MRWLLLPLFLALRLAVFGAEESKGKEPLLTPSAAPEAPPSSFVNSVHVTSGAFVFATLDLIVPGPAPLTLSHHYNSDTRFFNWMGCSSFASNFPLFIENHVERVPGTLNIIANSFIADEGNGTLARYLGGKIEHLEMFSYIDKAFLKNGFTNARGDEISGRTNIKNNLYLMVLKKEEPEYIRCAAHLCDGTRRYFSPITESCRWLHLHKEVIPSGNYLRFSYFKGGDSNLKSIEATDSSEKHSLGKLKFECDKKEHKATITATNGKKAHYYFFNAAEEPAVDAVKTSYIEKITSSDAPQVKFHYVSSKDKDQKKIYRIDRIDWPEGRFLELEYDDKGRVTTQKAPCGEKGEKHTVYTFDYHPHDRSTEVKDAYNRKTTFRYTSERRISEIKKYDSDHKVYCTEYFHWGEGKHIRIYAESPSLKVEYLYDFLNRRLKKKVSTPISGGWKVTKDEHYIYLGKREVGSTDPSGVIHELRLIGRGKGAEVGASIALELNKKVYIPIHDGRGNIVELLSTSGTIADTIHYTAFGECTAENDLSPWLFVSKRYDAETDLFYFGSRYYSATIGRWVTPDPLGFADGPNLYAYVHNSPLILVDPWGLLAEQDKSTSEKGGFWSSIGSFARGTFDSFTGQVDKDRMATDRAYAAGRNTEIAYEVVSVATIFVAPAMAAAKVGAVGMRAATQAVASRMAARSLAARSVGTARALTGHAAQITGKAGGTTTAAVGAKTIKEITLKDLRRELKQMKEPFKTLENPNKASHVMQDKHNWEKALDLSGDPNKDAREAADFMKENNLFGGKMNAEHYKDDRFVIEFKQNFYSKTGDLEKMEAGFSKDCKTGEISFADAWVK